MGKGAAVDAMVLDAPPEALAAGGAAGEAGDVFSRLKTLERHLEFLAIQEEYVKDEHKNLKRELLRAQEEVKRIQSVPLVIGQFLEAVDGTMGIVGSTTGSNYYVRILSTINRELLKPSASVALHRHSNALVDVLPPEADSSISLMSANEKPDVTYAARQSREGAARGPTDAAPARGRRTSAAPTYRSRRCGRLWSCR